jgi:hypothetical protein
MGTEERQTDITASGCVRDGNEHRGGGRLIQFVHRISTKKLTCRFTIVLSITESEIEEILDDSIATPFAL